MDILSIFSAFGLLGWLFFFKEFLVRWNNRKIEESGKELKVGESLTVGRLRCTTLTWKSKEHCIISDLQTGHMQIISSSPKGNDP